MLILAPGIELARLADLPADVLSEAKRVADKLSSRQVQSEEASESHKLSVRRKALLRVVFFAIRRSVSSIVSISSERSSSKLTSILRYPIGIC